MPRITRAAKTLVAQILQRYEDADIRNDAEPDGLGVHRALVVAEPVGEQLFDLLVPIAQTDRRIASLHVDDDKALTITFAADRHADDNSPFPLAEVESVQSADETDEVGSGAPDSPPVEEAPTKPAKKAAAKKATS